MLSSRPLMSNAADARYFVDRADGLQRLEAAIERRLNAIVFGERGMGKTSLLQHLVFRARERDATEARLVYVDGSIADDALGVIELVRDELGRAPDLADVLGGRFNRGLHPREHASEAAMALDLLRALRDAPPATIVLDGLPSPESGHTLFGRLRDELWQLPYAWIVATHPAARRTLLTPPADAFFEVQLTLEPLSIDDQVEMLARRMPPPGSAPVPCRAAPGWRGGPAACRPRDRSRPPGRRRLTQPAPDARTGTRGRPRARWA